MVYKTQHCDGTGNNDVLNFVLQDIVQYFRNRSLLVENEMGNMHEFVCLYHYIAF